MSKHTKGPWTVEGSFVKFEDGKFFIGAASNQGAYNHEEEKANLKLISAAPDLYEALRLATGIIENKFGTEFIEGRNAIAKAEGN